MDTDIICAEIHMSEPLRIAVAVETLLICVVSFVAQLMVIRATGKFAGWQSDFSYTVLRWMAVLAVQLYFGEIISHLRFALGSNSHAIDQILGASFITSFLTDTILGVTLILHRVAYTLYPHKAAKTLTSKVLKCHLLAILIFHVALFGLMLTPYVGYQFCPKSLQRFPVEGIATPIILWMNTVCNYMVGVTALTAYSTICIFLFLRGNLTFRSNAEVRLTLQDRHFLNLDEVPSVIIYETLTLFYYNAEFAPYFLLNKTFRSECLRFLPSSRKKMPTVSVATRTIIPNKTRKGQESI
ncbi:hypothetical protein Aduo_014261 [Ancylostoma duodenale]